MMHVLGRYFAAPRIEPDIYIYNCLEVDALTSCLASYSNIPHIQAVLICQFTKRDVLICSASPNLYTTRMIYLALFSKRISKSDTSGKHFKAYHFL